MAVRNENPRHRGRGSLPAQDDPDVERGKRQVGLWLREERRRHRLREAAALSEDPRLATFLEKRAAAFASNDYLDSDIAWMDLGEGPGGARDCIHAGNGVAVGARRRLAEETEEVALDDRRLLIPLCDGTAILLPLDRLREPKK